VVRAEEEAAEEGIDIEFVDRRMLLRGDLQRFGNDKYEAVGEEEDDELALEPIMSEGRVLSEDVAASDCSMETLQALSLAWRGNISSFTAELYGKKAELAAASMTLLAQYRNRYTSDAPTATAANPAWDVAMSNESRDAMLVADTESTNQREVVNTLREELGSLARRHMASYREYAAIGRSMQMCRRQAMGLPPPSNVCNKARLAEFDALAGFGASADGAAVNESAKEELVTSAEEALADSLLEVHEMGATDAVNESSCDDHEDLVSSVDRARGELSCMRKWVMKKVSAMLKEAKKVLLHYNSYWRKCGGRNRRGRSSSREAYCARVGAALEEARETVKSMMRHANVVGRRLMKQTQTMAKTLQAKQRCRLARISPSDDAKAAVAEESACGPLAPISMGAIMDTIEPLMGEADQQVGELLGGQVFEDLKGEVSKVSAKLFCLAEDLKARVPIDKAIDLLKVYSALIKGCGGGYNEARGLCGAQMQLDNANPEMSRRQARAAGKACVAAAKVEKKACAARLLPKFQTLREEIIAEMKSLNEDARAAWRWLETKAELLKPKYAAMMAQMQAHVDRYSDMQAFKQLRRSIDVGAIANQGGGRRQLSGDGVNNIGLNASEVADAAQGYLLEAMGLADFKDEANETEVAGAETYGDDDDELAGSTCDAWMLSAPAWLAQCPDICVPFCCPRQGCCSGCPMRTSCTETYLANLSRSGTCYSCFTDGCELSSGSAPSTCMQFDSSEGAATSAGPNAAPDIERLRGADSGVMASGPYNPRDSKPLSYQVLISNIRMCKNLICDGSQEGSTSITIGTETHTESCVKGYVQTIPTQCIGLYTNEGYGHDDGQMTVNAEARLSADPEGNNEDQSTGARYSLDSNSGCGKVRDAQAAGLYLDLADPTAGRSFNVGTMMRASDAGSYNYIMVQLAGDYIVRAEVPLTSGAKLYTQPCGCEACPNDAAHSSTGSAQPNPDVLCGGGGCASCAMTNMTEFVASTGAIRDELGVQVKMCANDLRKGPPSEVSVRQYAEMEFFLNDPIVVTADGFESKRSRPNASAATAPVMREECFSTAVERLGVDWASAMALGASELADLVVAYEVDTQEAAALSLGESVYYGHLGLHVWHDATPWCAIWLSDVLSSDSMTESADCALTFNASVAAVEQAALATLNTNGELVMAEDNAALLPVELAAAANASLHACAASVPVSSNATAAGFSEGEQGSCLEAAAEAFGEVAAGRVQRRVQILRAKGEGYHADLASLYGAQVCAMLPTPIDEAAPEQYTEVSQSVTVDLAYVLDGTVRAQVAPNKISMVPGSPGVYALDERPLEATRTQSAISDGVNAILVDDVQLTAVVRVENEALLRYRQIVSVGAACTPVRGHPCAYPTADYRTVNGDGSTTGRTSSCQREAEHGGTWYDTDANITLLTPSSPFQVLIDAFYTSVVGEGESVPSPSHLHSFRGISVRAVHTACDVGEPGYCPQDSGKECTAPMPFATFGVSRAVSSAGVVAGDLKPGVEGTARVSRDAMSEADQAWIEPPSPGSFDLVGFSGPEFLSTAIIKDYKPLGTLGEGYSTVQVLLRGQEIPSAMRRDDTEAPGGTRFENYAKTDMYFRCPAVLMETEVMREPLA
jgi:hypothetical protein